MRESIFHVLCSIGPGFSAAHHIATVWRCPTPLPEFTPPRFSFEALRKTASAAMVVGVVMGLTEAISISRAIAVPAVQQRLNANQEFIGQGRANIIGAFFSSLHAASGSLEFEAAWIPKPAPKRLWPLFSRYFWCWSCWSWRRWRNTSRWRPWLGCCSSWAGGSSTSRTSEKRSQNQPHGKRRAHRRDGGDSVVQLGFAIYLGVMLSLMLYLKRTAQPRIVDVKPDPADETYFLA